MDIGAPALWLQLPDLYFYTFYTFPKVFILFLYFFYTFYTFPKVFQWSGSNTQVFLSFFDVFDRNRGFPLGFSMCSDEVHKFPICISMVWLANVCFA